MKNKKDIVYEILTKNYIDICALQEVEIPSDYQHKLLSSTNYKIEVEKSQGKARVATVIKNNIEYTRRHDLEKEDSSVIIIDTNTKPRLRVINIYRSFNPPNNKSPFSAFEEQLSILKNCLNESSNHEVIILGDFNLDFRSKNLITYRLKNYFDALDTLTDHFNLSQIIVTPTWQRIVNGQLKESVLDHVYLKNPVIATNIQTKKTLLEIIIWYFST